MTDFESLLRKQFEQAGYNATGEQFLQFTKYYEFLIEYNKKVNLTAINEPLEVIQKHFIDSLFPLKAGLLPQNARCCDVGTGAGFPGVPLSIMRPDLKMTLFDALNKRLTFINELLVLLDLKNCTTVHSRAEDAGKNMLYREQFDIVLSRAVARMSVLAELNLPFAKVGGYMLALKGPSAKEELAEAVHAMSVLGGSIVKVITDPSIKGYDHVLTAIKKVKPTPAAYPRKSGTPEKNPL